MAAETEAAKSSTKANELSKDLDAARGEIAKLKQELESKEAAMADKLQVGWCERSPHTPLRRRTYPDSMAIYTCPSPP